MRLIENAKIMTKDAIDATGGMQTSTNSFDMTNYEKCLIMLRVKCSDAAVVAGTVTLKQGTSTTCATALAFTEYWKNEDLLAGDTLTHVTASTLATAGIQAKEALYLFEVQASDLTATYNHIRLDMTDITTATEITNLTYIGYQPRTAKGGDAMPTAFA